MANDSSITVNDSSGGTSLVLAEAISGLVGEAVRENSIALPFCHVENIEGLPSLAASFPLITGLTASALSNNYDATSNTQFALTDVVASTVERTVAVSINDSLAKSTTSDVIALAAGDMGAAMSDAFDVSALALIAAFGTPIGTSNAALSWANVIQGVYAFRLAAKAMAGYGAFIFDPVHVRDLILEQASASAGLGQLHSTDQLARLFGQDDVGAGVLQSHCGNIMGIPAFQTGNCPAASSVNKCGCLMVVGQGRSAIGAAIKWSPRIETARETVNGRMGTKLLGSYMYGVIERRDAYGVTFETKGT
jgi:hypothetical protein